MVLSFCVHAGVLAFLLTLVPVPEGGGLPETLPVEVLLEAPAPIPEPPAPIPEPTRVQEVPPPSKPLPAPVPRRVVTPRPQAELPVTVAEPAASGDVTGTSSTAVVAEAAPAVPAGPPPSIPGNGAEDLMAEYAGRVWARISAHKPWGVRLPGAVSLIFTIAPDGSLRSLGVAGGDGGGLLEQTALDTVRRSAPFPPPPPEATERQRTFSIPFHFR